MATIGLRPQSMEVIKPELLYFFRGKVVPKEEQRSAGWAKGGDIGVNRGTSGIWGYEPLLMLCKINMIMLNDSLVITE